MSFELTNMMRTLSEAKTDANITMTHSKLEYLINLILKDALYGFIAKRQHPAAYVDKGYPEKTLKSIGMTREDKIKEVMFRRDIAKVLHSFSDVKIKS